MKKTIVLVSLLAAAAVTLASCGPDENTSLQSASDASQNGSVQEVTENNEPVQENAPDETAEENKELSETTAAAETEASSDQNEKSDDENVSDISKYEGEWYCAETDVMMYIDYYCENIVFAGPTYTEEVPAVPSDDRIIYGDTTLVMMLKDGNLVDESGNVYVEITNAVEGHEDIEKYTGIRYCSNDGNVYIMQIFKNGTYYMDNADYSVSTGKISINGNEWLFTPASGDESFTMTFDEYSLRLKDEDGNEWITNRENPYIKCIAGSSK